MKRQSAVRVALAGPLWIGLTGAIAPRLIAEPPCWTQPGERADAQAIAENRGIPALSVALQQLHTRASMLMVTAHPDDEDGATLAYASRTLGARVGLLTLNRGEGGANEMSADLWDALGLVRTEELLQADRYYCATQYFTVATDYGFSKGLDEAVQKWGDDKAVFADVVRVVRTVRPLIITSVFVGGPSDGHGNHAAAGMWAQKVFNAAGDPNVFPDQIKEGLRPWNPLKEYARVPASLSQGNVSPQGLYDYATHHWAPAGVQNYITGKFEAGAVSATIQIPTGTYSTANGLSDQQISRTGLGFQKSQNGGAQIPPAGPASSAYHRFGSRIAAADQEKSFFDGVDVSLAGIATLAGAQPPAFLTQGLSTIDGLVEQAMHTYTVADPGSIAPLLAQGLKATNSLADQVNASSLTSDAKYDVLHELNAKQTQFNDALALALGFSLNANVSDAPLPSPRPAGNAVAPATDEERAAARMRGGRARADGPTFPMAIPGQRFPVIVRLAEASAIPVKIDKISVEIEGGDSSSVQPQDKVSGQIDGGGTLNAVFAVQVPEKAQFTRPYFERQNIGQAAYDVPDPRYRTMALAPYPLQAHVLATYGDVQIHLSEAVQAVQREVGPGVLYQPLPIGPAISVTMQQSAGIVPLGESAFPVSVKIHNDVNGPAQGAIHLDLPAGWKSQPATESFSFAQDGQEQMVTFNVSPGRLTEQTYKITAIATYDGHDYKEGYIQIGYPGLRPYYLYSAATYMTTGTNVSIAKNLQVGYIEGSGDDVPASLENLGVHVHFLAQADLAGGDLGKYNVIVVGVRAYAVRSDLRTYNARLLDYVKNGGSVVVQYETPEFDHNFGPYPYTMTNDPEEVTDEVSTVTFVDPSSAVLHWPNTITAKDFTGWIEERGSKFMKTWDPQYQAPLETHDAGQDPQKGGLLIAHYGKGVYVYTAYAFYRQLPLGVPGAYRLFANLLSISQNPQYMGKK
jgi:LmbE family N-acetylglucosaminyl deacetylase